MPLFGNRKNTDRALPAEHDNQSSTWFVPEELRDDYAAHMPTDTEVTERLNALISARVEASKVRVIGDAEAKPEGGFFTAEDEPLAVHRARLDFARHAVEQRRAAEQAERERQAAKCACCGALDVPTRPLAFSLRPDILPGESRRNDARRAGLQMNSHGDDLPVLVDGRLCAPCAATVHDECVKYVGGQLTESGESRRERAKRFARNALAQ